MRLPADAPKSVWIILRVIALLILLFSFLALVLVARCLQLTYGSHCYLAQTLASLVLSATAYSTIK
jgi:hypothetical protein